MHRSDQRHSRPNLAVMKTTPGHLIMQADRHLMFNGPWLGWAFDRLSRLR
jgi:hypothetical protein